jgi:oxygen-independent coproporphyrinogen-3 oxidase
MIPADVLLAGSPYRAYVYAYPHKTAYRQITPPRRLDGVWRDEGRDALLLYLHVPFCEMRCGFCNLFTTARPQEELVATYLDALARQIARVRSAILPATFVRVAIGGGTPTMLDDAALARALDQLESMGVELSHVPFSVETSPSTCSPSKVRLLRERGVDRMSLGVQSFDDREAATVKRPQRREAVYAALDAIRDAGLPTLNVDLIYGLPGQTIASWKRSLEEALRWAPEEMYLYPLYVRPLTSLGRSVRSWDDQRLALYRFARDFLRAAGYEARSMRLFRRRTAAADDGPVYCVQEDGMVGLGAGARSYTRALHYGSNYAVGARAVRGILERWIARSPDEFDYADHGFELDGDEQRRRFVLLGLLSEGLDCAAYRRRFRTNVFDELPMGELLARGLAVRAGERIELTDLGVERSDAIGPWLFSDAVRARMESHDAQ